MLKVTLPETNSSDLKMDGWKMTCDLGAWPVIHGHLDHHFFDPIQLSYFQMLLLMVQKSYTTWDVFPKTRRKKFMGFQLSTSTGLCRISEASTVSTSYEL